VAFISNNPPSVAPKKLKANIWFSWS